MSKPSIPTIVTLSARSYGNIRLGYQFVNAIGYPIDDPRPF